MCNHVTQGFVSPQVRAQRAALGMRAQPLLKECTAFMGINDPQQKAAAWSRIASFIAQEPEVVMRQVGHSFVLRNAIVRASCI